MGTRGLTNGGKSATRSEALKGRPSNRKGKRNERRSSIVRGLPERPPADPRPSLPTDRVYVACLPIVSAARQFRLGSYRRGQCCECEAHIGINYETEKRALAHGLRDSRPLAYIGLHCCLNKFQISKVKQ
jgi:hypothetical protein